jgi:hypothetical protein
MLQQIIQLVTILFLLSMVCERIADFLKNYLSDSQFLGLKKEFFKIGDTITKFPQEDAKEYERKFRILKINVWSGVILAAILKADLIIIFNNIDDPGKTLGWKYISEYEIPDIMLLPFGIVMTGFFISFGSKFWHDLLDILYQIKNTKRVLADPETYKVDNIKSLKKLYDTYQSDFIKAAYLEAKTSFLAMDNVKAIGIKSNELGYYFEITVSKNTNGIDQFYPYLLDDGTPQNIPVKVVMLANEEKIVAHGIDLSSLIFAKDQQANWGTLGVIVEDLTDSKNKYLLTCCHNVVRPIKTILNGSSIEAEAKEKVTDTATIPIGKVVKACRDSEIDAALIEINNMQNIDNTVIGMGRPRQSRKLLDRDAGKVTAYMYGAASQNNSSGVVGSIYNDVKIEYSDTGDTYEFSIVNLIAISNNGKAISRSGDSGACVLDEDNKVLGLVVGGSYTTTYVLPIQTMLTKLNVKIA